MNAQKYGENSALRHLRTVFFAYAAGYVAVTAFSGRMQPEGGVVPRRSSVQLC